MGLKIPYFSEHRDFKGMYASGQKINVRKLCPFISQKENAILPLMCKMRWVLNN